MEEEKPAAQTKSVSSVRDQAWRNKDEAAHDLPIRLLTPEEIAALPKEEKGRTETLPEREKGTTERESEEKREEDYNYPATYERTPYNTRTRAGKTIYKPKRYEDYVEDYISF